MSFDLNRLLTPLSAAEDTGLAASDERLLALDALADKGDFTTAAQGMEELLDAGIYDLRPLPYYLYQAFVSGGYPALLTIFKVLENLLGPSREALRPVRRRDDYVNRRLHWLFDKIDAALAYHDKGNTAEWVLWHQSLESVVLAELLQAGGRVLELLQPALFLQAGTALGHVLARIRAQERPMISELADKAPAEATAVPSAESAPQSVAAVLAAKLTTDHSPGDGLQRIELLVSPRFLQLCRSLEAFETLIRKEHFAKAAVVLADISESLNHFDPRAHFPSLFAQFASLQSKHVRALSEHSDAHDSAAWQALQQYYQVDLKGFVES